jgi:pimeloyl-ACP methyl ester carboxylesterase
MEKVTSSDGTTIALERFSDAGPPLLMVVGAFSDRRSAAELTAALSEHFSVHGYDRRGRGDSGAGETAWSVRREIEDLQAVIGAIGAGDSVFGFGHSSGGALALEAAAAGTPFGRLAVYEPPYTGTAGSTLERAAELRALADAGRLDDAASLFLTGSGMPAERLEQMRRWDGWPGMVARAGTLGYDVGCCNDGHVPVDRLRRLGCPVTAYAGTALPWAAAATREIAAAVPDGRAELLEGQDHNPAPEALVPRLAGFLGSPS